MSDDALWDSVWGPSPSGQKNKHHCGWLTKQGGHYKSWKKRWFVIRGHQMVYFKDPTDTHPLGVITLALPQGTRGKPVCDIRHIPDDCEPKKPYCFEIKCTTKGGRTYLCYASSQKEEDAWLTALSQVVYASRGGGMFGTDITTQLQRENKGCDAVPSLVRACVTSLRQHGVDEVGIFRLPGGSVRIRELRQAFASGTNPDLSQAQDMHSVASLLKLYLRELPEPLLTYSLSPAFLAAAATYRKDPASGMDKIQSAVSRLPLGNAVVLRYLCQFLAEVVAKSDVNKMTLPNIATVFAPNFLASSAQNPSALMEETPLVHALTMALIQNHDVMFEKMPEKPRITAMIEKAEAAPATTSLDDFDHDEDDDTSSSAGGTTHDAAANGAGLGDSKISSPAAAFDIDSTKGGMQGPVRQLQMDLMAERQRREAAEAMLRRVRTGLLQAKHVWDQERACRLEAEQKLQTLVAQLRAMNVVLPNTADVDVVPAGGPDSAADDFFNLDEIAAVLGLEP